MGISNTIATVPGIIGNILAGSLLDNIKNNDGAWNTIFATSAAVYLVGGVVYLIFATAEPLRVRHDYKKVSSVNANEVVAAIE